MTRGNSEHGQFLLRDRQMNSFRESREFAAFFTLLHIFLPRCECCLPGVLVFPLSPRFGPPSLDSRIRFNGVTFVSDETSQTQCSFTRQC